ncbi:MAG: hypothetical protein QNK37_18035 [Acidobacteriota bacterium]|nr:hypothetical protein [Acidobacteriota bacterium]
MKRSQWFYRSPICLLLLPLLISTACQPRRADPRELELRRSYKNYLAALEELHYEGLLQYVYFPGVKSREYRTHVKNLQIDYLERVAEGKPVEFDEQGVVLSRFLRLKYYNYSVEEIRDINDTDTRMRISLHFNFDHMLQAADYEEGTKVYLPGSPLGTVSLYTEGGANEIPRTQLKYIEIDVVLRRTNHEGYYQVRRLTPVRNSEEFENSNLG